MTAPPFAWIYTVGMVATAGFIRFDKRNKVTSESGADLTTPVALLVGLCWMVWWPWYIAIHIYGRDKYLRWVAERQGGKMVWHAGDVELPGDPDDFPRVTTATVRAARKVGIWGALLTQGYIGPGIWATVAMRPGMPQHPTRPDLQAVVIFEYGKDEPSAREAFRWLTAAALEEKLEADGLNEDRVFGEPGPRPVSGVDFRQNRPP